MISNGKGNKQKYDANKVMIDNMSIVDYVNNKIVKLQNDLTSYLPYTYLINFKDFTMNLTNSYTSMPISSNVQNTYGTHTLFKQNNDNIEFIGTNDDNALIGSIIFFETNFSGGFGTGENVRMKLYVKDLNNTEKNYTFTNNTTLGAGSSNQVSGLLLTHLCKGDKIYFDFYTDQTHNAMSISKSRMFIINQINLPNEYYDFIN